MLLLCLEPDFRPSPFSCLYWLSHGPASQACVFAEHIADFSVLIFITSLSEEEMLFILQREPRPRECSGGTELTEL